MNKIYIARDNVDITISRKKIAFEGVNGNMFCYGREDDLIVARQCINNFKRIIGINIKKRQQIVIDIPDIKQFIKEIKS